MKRNKQTNKKNEIMKKINKRNEETIATKMRNEIEKKYNSIIKYHQTMNTTNKENETMEDFKQVFYIEEGQAKGFVDVAKTIGDDIYKPLSGQLITAETFKKLSLEIYRVIYGFDDNVLQPILLDALQRLCFDPETERFVYLVREPDIRYARANYVSSDWKLKVEEYFNNN